MRCYLQQGGVNASVFKAVEDTDTDARTDGAFRPFAINYVNDRAAGCQRPSPTQGATALCASSAVVPGGRAAVVQCPPWSSVCDALFDTRGSTCADLCHAYGLACSHGEHNSSAQPGACQFEGTRASTGAGAVSGGCRIPANQQRCRCKTVAALADTPCVDVQTPHGRRWVFLSTFTSLAQCKSARAMLDETGVDVNSVACSQVDSVALSRTGSASNTSTNTATLQPLPAGLKTHHMVCRGSVSTQKCAEVAAQLEALSRHAGTYIAFHGSQHTDLGHSHITRTGAVHCGGTDVDPLADGTPYGWTGGTAQQCVAKCVADPTCNAFVRVESDSACYWQTGVSASTIQEYWIQTGHSCYVIRADGGRLTAAPVLKGAQSVDTIITAVERSQCTCAANHAIWQQWLAHTLQVYDTGNASYAAALPRSKPTSDAMLNNPQATTPARRTCGDFQNGVSAEEASTRGGAYTPSGYATYTDDGNGMLAQGGHIWGGHCGGHCTGTSCSFEAPTTIGIPTLPPMPSSPCTSPTQRVRGCERIAGSVVLYGDNIQQVDIDSDLVLIGQGYNSCAKLCANNTRCSYFMYIPFCSSGTCHLQGTLQGHQHLGPRDGDGDSDGDGDGDGGGIVGPLRTTAISGKARAFRTGVFYRISMRMAPSLLHGTMCYLWCLFARLFYIFLWYFVFCLWDRRLG